MGIRKTAHDNFPPEVAANGLIDRRALLGRGVLIAGAMGTGVSASPIRAAAAAAGSTALMCRAL